MFHSTFRTYKSRGYIEAIDTFNTTRFDVVLVDGRYRVACALRALKYTDQESVVIIHDFHRRVYHVVLDYYEVVERADTLIVLRKKKNLPFPQDVYDKYVLIQN